MNGFGPSETIFDLDKDEGDQQMQKQMRSMTLTGKPGQTNPDN